MTVNTKTAARRTLHFESLDDLLADVDAAGDAPGSTGNWTAAQNVEHVSRLIGGSFDGFDAKGPLLIRLLLKVMRGSVLNRPMKPGIKLPANFTAFVPPADVTWADATAHLRRLVERARAGEQMTHPSPILGAMSNEDWVKLHCRHAEMHFGFIQPAAG
ncbi:MAG: DUF1569 domain-containing protein [Phycisphaerales bacterium]|nr:DUF1569 domain-containing protein [Phycisphaerales bacterium]